MKRASWDTIDEHYREHYPGPHYAMGIHHAFRGGWKTCESQIDQIAIAEELYDEYLGDEDVWEYTYNRGTIRTDYTAKIDFDDWLEERRGK